MFAVGQIAVHTDYYKRKKLVKVLRIDGTWRKEGQEPTFMYSVRGVKSERGEYDLHENEMSLPTEAQLKQGITELEKVRRNAGSN